MARTWRKRRGPRYWSTCGGCRTATGWSCPVCLGTTSRASRAVARAHALNTLGVVHVLTRDPDIGLKVLEESREIAIAIGSEEDVVRHVGNATFVLQNPARTE